MEIASPRGSVHAELTDAVEAVDHPTALENILFSRFGIDDLRGFAFPLAILLGQVGDGFARVGPCPGRILDARRRVGQDLISSSAVVMQPHRPMATSNIARRMAYTPM
jgi:hypothetical protein